jgi:hypothetical protein
MDSEILMGAIEKKILSNVVVKTEFRTLGNRMATVNSHLKPLPFSLKIFPQREDHFVLSCLAFLLSGC